MFLEITVMLVIAHYMEKVTLPFIGYRVKTAYRHLLPPCNNRPTIHSLSAIYAIRDSIAYQQAEEELMTKPDPCFYPGRH